MILRFNALLVTFLFLAGQVFAQVTVSVNMRQTGPVDTAGRVVSSVGKNTDATYSATASYNGQPTLHAEEKVTGTAWTYVISPGPGATSNPTGTSKGGCTISKFGNSATRIPNNQSDYDKAPKNYTGGFKYAP